MKILHVASTVTNIYTLATAQRALGLTVDVISFLPNIRNNFFDIYLPTKLPPFIQSLKKTPQLINIAKKYDIIHFHGTSGCSFYLDFLIYKKMGKKIVLHHRGIEWPNFYKKEYFMSRFADYKFISTPDLLTYSPNAEWLPNPINIENIKLSDRKSNNNIINVVHPPTSIKQGTYKGTSTIIKTMEEIQRERPEINFQLVLNKTHKEALEIYKSADIIVDQLLVGFYGMVTIESMALGIPVVCFVHDNYGDIPVWNATVDTFKDRLLQLADDRNALSSLSKKGREYVERVHDSAKVARRTLEVYESIY
ncbi:glycosyltransferase family 4 protein [Methanocalculus sp. MC3]